MAAVEAKFSLSDEHQSFIELITETREGIFYLTGPAGSGKSTLIEYLRRNIFQKPLCNIQPAARYPGQVVDCLFR